MSPFGLLSLNLAELWIDDGRRAALNDEKDTPAEKIIRVHERFLFYSFVILLAIMTILALFTRYQFNDILLTETYDRGREFEKNLQATFSPLLVTYNYSTIYNAVNTMAAQQHVVYIAIYDKELNLAACNSFYRENVDKIRLVSPSPLAQVNRSAFREGTLSLPGGKDMPVLDIISPVYMQPSALRWGVIHVGTLAGKRLRPFPEDPPLPPDFLPPVARLDLPGPEPDVEDDPAADGCPAEGGGGDRIGQPAVSLRTAGDQRVRRPGGIVQPDGGAGEPAPIPAGELEPGTGGADRGTHPGAPADAPVPGECVQHPDGVRDHHQRPGVPDVRQRPVLQDLGIEPRRPGQAVLPPLLLPGA